MRRPRGSCLRIILFLGLACLALLGGLLYLRKAKLTEHCQRNVATLGAALKLYADSHHGLYPPDLKSLGLQGSPACAVAEETYDKSYHVAADLKSCSICCPGQVDLHGLGIHQPSWKSP